MKWLGRSLGVKLLAAFALAGLLGLLLQAIALQTVTLSAFSNYVGQSRMAQVAALTLEHYRNTGSLEGLRLPAPPPRLENDPTEPNRPPPDPMARMSDRPPGAPPSLIGLLDDKDRVVLQMAGMQAGVGERVNPELFPVRREVRFEGQKIATVLRQTARIHPTPEEQAFTLTIQRSLLWTGVLTGALALGLGALMARGLIRPLQRLTVASQGVVLGKPAPQVPVRGEDEIAQLGRAFNRMGSDLADADRQRRQMLADIAHDLGTPLTVAAGYVQSMRDGKLQVTQERLETVHDELGLLKNLVDDLRLLSLADAGKLKLNMDNVPPALLLSSVTKAFQHRAEKHGVELKLEVPTGLPNIRIDPERMRQVLGNLVSNALRYTPEDGQVCLSARFDADTVLFEVTDTGTGIPAEKLPHIFDRFYRADESRTTSNGEGSGLGLAIAKAIVELHDGTISAHSREGQGTTVQIRLRHVTT